MATASKRKRVVLSLETKLEILNRLPKGESQAHLASKYGIGKTTVFDLKQNEGICCINGKFICEQERA